MASGEGPSLGAAVHALLRVSPVEHRSIRQQLSYVTAKTTGASLPSVARQLGTTQRNLRAWVSGSTVPNRANRTRIEQLFDRFWEINNRSAAGRNPGSKPLRVRGPIYVNGKERKSVIVEQGRHPRDWELLRTSSPDAISADNGQLFKDALEVPIPYIEFRPGHYVIIVL